VDGSYELRDLPAGDMSIGASKERLGRARATFVTGAGQVLTWNARLDPGNAIRGIVTDGAGVAQEGVSVTATVMNAKDEQRKFSASDRTNKAGEFVLTGLLTDPGICYRLVFWVKRDYGDVLEYGPTPDALLPSVEPNTGPLVVVLGGPHSPSCFVEASIAEQDGAPAAGAILLRGDFDDLLRVFNCDPTTGKLRVGPLYPGQYEYQMKRLPDGVLARQKLELKAGETRDLGTVCLALTGTLRLLLERPPGLDANAVVRITSHDAMWDIFGSHTLDDPREPVELPLGPGEYDLMVSGGGIAPAREKFAIRSGAATEVTVRLRAQG
jgi:hypothetical protein